MSGVGSGSGGSAPKGSVGTQAPGAAPSPGDGVGAWGRGRRKRELGGLSPLWTTVVD